jgi:hypothetical protein
VDSNGWRLGIRWHSSTWSTGENVDRLTYNNKRMALWEFSVAFDMREIYDESLELGM